MNGVPRTGLIPVSENVKVAVGFSLRLFKLLE
jgi:hypothetical protein